MATMITSKAVQTAKTAGLSPNFDITQIVAIIQQIFAAISNCNPTAAKVHQSISNPGPLQRISLRRTVRAHVPNVAMRQTIEDAVVNVGQASTEKETTTMYQEATGKMPG